MLRRLLTEGVCIDKDTFLETMRPLCGDLTFAEATLTLTGPSPNLVAEAREGGRRVREGFAPPLCKG